MSLAARKGLGAGFAVEHASRASRIGSIGFAIAFVALVAAPGFAALTSRPDGSTYVKGVVTQSNRAVRSVWVIASQSGVERGRALTGDDGKYYIAGLGSGAYDIVVFQGKQQIFSGRINLPENRLFNITITPPRALRRGR